MNNLEKNVRIIEFTESNNNARLLEITFSKKDDIKLLFTPKLKNIGFVPINNVMTVTLKNPDFREYFDNWIINFVKKIKSNDSKITLIEMFNNEIKFLISIGKKEPKMSLTAAKGLYAELLLLESYLSKKGSSHIDTLDGWHRPAPANHDFDYANYSQEVKAISRDATTIKITSEHQLMAVENKPLLLQFYRIDHVKKSNEDSLGKIYNSIKEILEPQLSKIFEIKCAEDAFCEYLGPEHMPLDYKFITIEYFKYNVDQQEFPRVRKEKIDSGLSKVSYSIDVSSIEEFKIK
tara:strand:+ start:549 stop:1424 length:876 start_codon:yes stop_codon:yes gene_type:complete